MSLSSFSCCRLLGYARAPLKGKSDGKKSKENIVWLRKMFNYMVPFCLEMRWLGWFNDGSEIFAKNNDASAFHLSEKKYFKNCDFKEKKMQQHKKATWRWRFIKKCVFNVNLQNVFKDTSTYILLPQGFTGTTQAGGDNLHTWIKCRYKKLLASTTLKNANRSNVSFSLLFLCFSVCFVVVVVLPFPAVLLHQRKLIIWSPYCPQKNSEE